MDALKVFADLSYVRPEDVAAIPVLKSQPEAVIYSPLASCTAAPGVVVLFVDASQTLLLSEATQQVENQNPPAMGRPACAVIPQVANTGVAALSLGCCGARAYLDVLTEDVAIFAIPGSKLEAYVQRIEALASANAVLAKFHQIRRRDVEAGQTPSVKESLVAMVWRTAAMGRRSGRPVMRCASHTTFQANTICAVTGAEGNVTASTNEGHPALGSSERTVNPRPARTPAGRVPA